MFWYKEFQVYLKGRKLDDPLAGLGAEPLLGSLLLHLSAPVPPAALYHRPSSLVLGKNSILEIFRGLLENNFLDFQKQCIICIGSSNGVLGSYEFL